jgi:hypothetical protein
MNGSIEKNNDQFALPTPRTSLQNIGEKREDDEAGRAGHNFQAFGVDGFTFLDFLDVINPLQHIPLVGNMYRSLTGDEIDPGSRIAGSTLFGGPIGTVVALANVTIEQKTGQDMGGHMMALLSGVEDNSPTDESGVTFANSTQPSSFANTSSPITTNAEVLEWAQLETAHFAEATPEAQLKTSPQRSVTTPLEASNITTNIEVLNWARQEAILSRPAFETETARIQDKNRATKQTELDGRKAALSANNAMGRDQAQLSGATAPLGGWFSETMLIALARYDDGAQLGKGPSEKRSVETIDANE